MTRAAKIPVGHMAKLRVPVFRTIVREYLHRSVGSWLGERRMSSTVNLGTRRTDVENAVRSPSCPFDLCLMRRSARDWGQRYPNDKPFCLNAIGKWLLYLLTTLNMYMYIKALRPAKRIHPWEHPFLILRGDHLGPLGCSCCTIASRTDPHSPLAHVSI